MTTLRTVALLFTVLVIGVRGGSAFAQREQVKKLRTWTDSTGKHTVEAEFVDVTDGNVRLRTEEGRMINIPLERLSEADQEFVRGENKARSPSWESDVLAFRKAVSRAVDAARPKGSGTDNSEARKAVGQFEGKAVRWKMTFLTAEANGRLDFLESNPAKGRGHFLGKTIEFVILSVTSDPGSLADWRALPRNSVVTCEATISSIDVGTRLTAGHRFAGWAPFVFLEKARPGK